MREKRKRKDSFNSSIYTPGTKEARQAGSIQQSRLPASRLEDAIPLGSAGEREQSSPICSGQLRARHSDASDTTAAQVKDFRADAPVFDPTDAEADHQQPAASGNAGETQYIANTRIPVDGWIQACRCCSTWTSAMMIVRGEQAPVCRRCQRKAALAFHRHDSERDQLDCRTDLAQLAASDGQPISIGNLSQRQEVCEHALQQLEDHWPKYVANHSAAR